MLHHFLLLGMLISYTAPIIYVIRQFNLNTTLSDIICDEKCKNHILFYMIIMGVFTIFYESIHRKDMESIVYISILLLSIYGLLNYGPETDIHYLFAITSFFCIFAFMVQNTKNDYILGILTCLNYMILLSLTLCIKDDYMICECAYLFLFALFYIYLHFLPKGVESV
jgi:hypothetical protein